MNVTVIIATLLIAIIIYIINYLNNRRLKKQIIELRNSLSNYEHELITALIDDYNILDGVYKSNFEGKREDIIDTMDIMCEDGDRIKIDEALVILQKQNKGWFDQQFESKTNYDNSGYDKYTDKIIEMEKIYGTNS